MVFNNVTKRSNKYSERVEILKQYNNSKTSKELCIILGMKQRTLSELRHRSGIRSPYCEKGSRLKHLPKTDIADFDLGWCLGFFAADGSMYNNRIDRSPITRIGVTLSIKDIKCLFNFYNTLLCGICYSDFQTKPPTLGKTDKISYIASMPSFIEVIKQFLIFQNKTYDLRINKETFGLATNEFRLGFLRGVIDGDGWVHKKGRYISIVSASENFIIDLHHFFGGRIKKRKKNYWDICFKKEEVKQLLELGMNVHPEITLTRKDERLNRFYDPDRRKGCHN